MSFYNECLSSLNLQEFNPSSTYTRCLEYYSRVQDFCLTLFSQVNSRNSLTPRSSNPTTKRFDRFSPSWTTRLFCTTYSFTARRVLNPSSERSQVAFMPCLPCYTTMMWVNPIQVRSRLLYSICGKRFSISSSLMSTRRSFSLLIPMKRPPPLWIARHSTHSTWEKHISNTWRWNWLMVRNLFQNPHNFFNLPPFRVLKITAQF